VTFNSASLALGVRYGLTVDPIAFGGSQLALSTAEAVTIGTSPNNQMIMLSDLEGSTGNGLYVTGVSTSAVSEVTASGQLVITFNEPVTLNNPNDFTVASSTPVQFNNPAVTATLSSDGLTLTLTPNWTDAPTIPGAYVAYGDGTAAVTVAGSPAQVYSVISGAPMLDVVNGVQSRSVPILNSCYGGLCLNDVMVVAPQ